MRYGEHPNIVTLREVGCAAPPSSSRTSHAYSHIQPTVAAPFVSSKGSYRVLKYECTLYAVVRWPVHASQLIYYGF